MNDNARVIQYPRLHLEIITFVVNKSLLNWRSRSKGKFIKGLVYIIHANVYLATAFSIITYAESNRLTKGYCHHAHD